MRFQQEKFNSTKKNAFSTNGGNFEHYLLKAFF